MPDSLHAGALLADRYRLDELLTESAGGRFWRAHDQVLDRNVAVHLLGRTNPRAAGLLDAARRTAPHHDRRLLRVLDADQTDELCYVVNEWGDGTSLDIMLAAGPLQPRRAAWVASEVADSLARAHDAGLDHGRMVCENVLIDRHGQVRIIGFGVDAALHGLAPGRQSVDLVDTVGVLYAALTGKWAGASYSGLPPAPTEHGEVLRPRQVRAGIPRSLDSLCDQVINAGPANRARPHVATMAEVAAALAEFVGDPTGLAEDDSWAGPAAPIQPFRPIAPIAPIAPMPPLSPVVPAEAPEPVSMLDELPTQAGIPVFDDFDDVGWIPTRSESPTPPPPFEDKPAKPLFAPEPPVGQPVRRPRPGTNAEQASPYWPWEATGPGSGATGNPNLTPNVTTGSGAWPKHDTGSAELEVVPGRNWFRLAMGIALGVLLLVAAATAYHLTSGEQEEEPETPPATTASPSAPATPLIVDSAEDFDPQGSAPREENPQLAPLAVDGDPATAWRTSTYKQNFGPGGLKDGVGLVLDLGATMSVRSIDVTTVGGPTAVSVFVTTAPPTGVADLTPVGEASGDGNQAVVLDKAASGRFVTVWLTSLPPVDGGFRGTIADVVVKG